MFSRIRLVYILLIFYSIYLQDIKKANKIFSSGDDFLADSVTFPLTQEADQLFTS